MRDSARLLARAQETWRRHRAILEPLAQKEAFCGFAGGARWMRAAAGLLRGAPPSGQADFTRLGLLKYGAASGGALAAVLLIGSQGPGWLPLALVAGVLAFYGIEAQGVFLFPAALDGSAQPWRESRRLLAQSGGTWPGVVTILPLAFGMLTGGLRGQGLLRSWCLGCLAVLHWHEEILSNPGWTADETALPKLALGPAGPILLRTERLAIAGARGRIAWVSDLHWHGRTPASAGAQLLAALRHARPDAVVLGGDLADTRAGLVPVRAFVASLAAQFPVLAIEGNHDRLLGRGVLREAIEAAGALWLEDTAWNPPGPLGWSLAGPGAPEAQSGAGVRVRCRHDPEGWQNDTAQLTLAGHLHGGQVALWQSQNRHFPAVWVYRWCGLRFARGQRALVVSRGLGDTLPLRWKTPREVILLEFIENTEPNP